MKINELETTVEQSLSQVGHAVASKIKLYRGMRVVPFKDEFVKSIRQDRQAQASAPYEVRLFDLYCEVLGAPHRKSNTLSTSVSIHQAADFGITVFQILPFDGSTYLYSTTHRDFLDLTMVLLKCWNEEHESIMEATDDEVRNFLSNHRHLESIASLVFTKDINETGNAKGEVLVHGSQYVAKFFDHLNNKW